jgi:hypothetical protein
MYPNNDYNKELLLQWCQKGQAYNLAYQNGRARRAAGLSLSPNPYSSPQLRGAYEAGWKGLDRALRLGHAM